MAAAAAMCMSALSTSTVAMAESVEYDDDAVIVWGLTSSWADLTPFSNNSGNSYSGIVISMLYDKLVYCTKEGIYPRAALSWEISDDSMSMTFHLNPESTFHDGKPVTANDWVFAMNLLADPESGFADHSSLNIFAGTNDAGDVEEGQELGIKALDDYTLEVDFKNPMKADTFLISYSWLLAPLPEHLLGDLPSENIASNEFFQAPIGSGPCKFVSVSAGSELTLERFEEYPLADGHYDKMVLKVMSSTALSTAMMSGEIDCAFSQISNDEALGLSTWTTLPLLQ
jgi:peptide/nickel transport system substrate-binding protein